MQVAADHVGLPRGPSPLPSAAVALRGRELDHLIQRCKALPGFNSYLTTVLEPSVRVTALPATPASITTAQKARETVAAWDQAECASIEADLDRIGADEAAIPSRQHHYMYDSINRVYVVNFLRIRLVVASAERLPEAMARLMTFHSTFPRVHGFRRLPMVVLHSLARRIHEVPLPRPDLAALLDRLADELPECLRAAHAGTFATLDASCRRGGFQFFKDMGCSLTGIERNALGAAWVVRHSRSKFLACELDAFRRVRDDSLLWDTAKMVTTAPTRPGSWGLSMDRMIYDLDKFYREEPRSAWTTMLLARCLAARLRQDPLPLDPLARDGRALRTFARDGWIWASSVGSDGVDDGDEARDLVVRLWPEQSAPAPTTP
ncbi:MAG: hypothetical protein H0V44_18150 [Planctomycetes bacterium]|nr:hypothetical protein [Planctomycetota bacterium]